MIIGITGTDGAGKGAAVAYLVERYHFMHCSAREHITTEITKQGLPVNREQMRLVANALRKQHGNDYVVRHYLEQFADVDTDIVIESIRAMAEVETLKREGGILLAIDAAETVRFARIMERKSESDRITLEQFVAHEALEMNDPDPNGMQKAQVIAAADYTIMNDGSLSDLYVALDKFMQLVTV